MYIKQRLNEHQVLNFEVILLDWSRHSIIKKTMIKKMFTKRRKESK